VSKIIHSHNFKANNRKEPNLTSDSSTKLFKLGVALAAYCIGYFLILFSHFEKLSNRYACLDIYNILPPLFAGIAAVRLTKEIKSHKIEERIGWLALSLGFFSWTLGQIIWSGMQILMNKQPVGSAYPEIGYTATYPLITIGLLYILKALKRPRNTTLLMDASITLGSIIAIAWSFIFTAYRTPLSLSPVTCMISIMAPVADFMIMLGALVVIASDSKSKALFQTMLHLGIGFAFITAADLAYVYYMTRASYYIGRWPDFCWTLGWLTIGWGISKATLTKKLPKCIENSPGSLSLFEQKDRSLILPYVISGIGFGIAVYHDIKQMHSITFTTTICGYLSILLIIIRQAATLLENGKLTEALRAQLKKNTQLNEKLKTLNERLEDKVAHRERQILVFRSLSVDMSSRDTLSDVMRSALFNSCRALKANGGLIWREICGTDQFELVKHCGFEQRSSLLSEITDLPNRQMLEAGNAIVMTISGNHFLIAPILSQSKVIGAIATLKWSAKFDSSDAKIIESIGAETGSAICLVSQKDAANRSANIDSVTGLLNHRALQEEFEEEFKKALQSGSSVAIVLIDLDDFKIFNDTHGHPLGDHVLKEVAQIATRESPQNAVIGRYGSDEFLIVLPGFSSEQAHDLATRVQKRLLHIGFRQAHQGSRIPISISFGVAAMPEDSRDRHEILSIAEQNLHMSKSSSLDLTPYISNNRLHQSLQDESSFKILDAIVTAIDNKDRYTRRHSEDVAKYALWIAKSLQMPEEQQEIVRRGALLHDLGKIGIPGQILAKPAALNSDEYEIMKGHPYLGSLIVRVIPELESLVDGILTHHERWDGKGYPDGLKETDIPLVGRILAVADAFSAMTTDRPYRKGMNWKTACDEIERGAGLQFDPAIAMLFLKAVNEKFNLEEENTQGSMQFKAA
jgi:diguanylate cyclase (GGDEF)-like protein/putative nucleotidyltransferase with HDIG domain